MQGPDALTAKPLGITIPGPQWLTIATATFLVLVSIAYPQFVDPFIRHDDYLALHGDAEGYFPKAGSEMRWITYLWHMRDWLWPAPVNFALYMICWSLWCATFTVQIAGGRSWIALALSLVVATNVFSVVHALWFNTLLPGMAILALYGVLSVGATPRTRLAMLLPTAFLTFLCYTTFPMLALLNCLSDRSMHGVRRFLQAVSVLSLAVASAVGVSLLLNAYFEGTLIAEVETWRYKISQSFEVRFFSPVIQALPHALIFFRSSLCYLLFLLPSVFLLFRTRPCVLLCLGGAAVLGAVPLMSFIAYSKIGMTSYAFVFVPVALVSIFVLAYRTYVTGRLVILLLCLAQLADAGLFLRRFETWQAETRAIAELVSHAPGAVYVYGDPLDLPSSRRALLFHVTDFRYRIRDLSGKDLRSCDRSPAHCPEPGTFDWQPSGITGLDVARGAGGTAFRVAM